MSRSSFRWISIFLVLGVAVCVQPRHLLSQGTAKSLGIFEGSTDVGSVTPPGTVAYDPAAGTYTMTAAGANLWSMVDGFHFLWKKVSGDVSLTADVDFPDKTGNPSPHRKALLMFRQNLDADGVYADAAQHGSGLTALQYRRAKGASTQDIELNIASPMRLRIEKRGDTITMFLSMTGEPLHGWRVHQASSRRAILCRPWTLLAQCRLCGEGDILECRTQNVGASQTSSARAL